MRKVDSSGLHFDRAFDFALAFWMLHEVPDKVMVLAQVHASLKPGGRFLLVEPKGHVSQAAFRRTLELAENVGFTKSSDRPVSMSRAVSLLK